MYAYLFSENMQPCMAWYRPLRQVSTFHDYGLPNFQTHTSIWSVKVCIAFLRMYVCSREPIMSFLRMYVCSRTTNHVIAGWVTKVQLHGSPTALQNTMHASLLSTTPHQTGEIHNQAKSILPLALLLQVADNRLFTPFMPPFRLQCTFTITWAWPKLLLITINPALTLIPSQRVLANITHLSRTWLQQVADASI